MSENICDPVEPADCCPAPPPSHYVVTRPDGTSVTVTPEQMAPLLDALFPPGPKEVGEMSQTPEHDAAAIRGEVRT